MFCWAKTDRREKIITFAYHVKEAVNYIEKKDLDSSRKYLQNLMKDLSIVDANLTMIRGNEYGHLLSIKNAQNVLKWGAIAKIGILLLFVSVNLQMLLGMLNSTQTKITELI